MSAILKALARRDIGPADLVRATIELARANRRLARSTLPELLDIAPSVQVPDSEKSPEIVRRVAFSVPRMAPIVPWRADCFIQALAAQSWLASLGIESNIKLGVRRGGGPLDAHAWLLVGNTVVTGGDVSPFSEFRLSGSESD